MCVPRLESGTSYISACHRNLLHYLIERAVDWSYDLLLALLMGVKGLGMLCYRERNRKHFFFFTRKTWKIIFKWKTSPFHLHTREMVLCAWCSAISPSWYIKKSGNQLWNQVSSSGHLTWSLTSGPVNELIFFL